MKSIVSDIILAATVLNTDIKDPYLNTGKIIAFRGTRYPSDLFADVRCYKRNFRNDLFVHAGFLHRYKHLKKDLPFPPPDIITGFSLGSAIASLYAYDCCIKKCPPSRVVLFAKPRVGNNKFAREFDKTAGKYTITLQNMNDPIINLPPRFMGYSDGDYCDMDFKTGTLLEHELYGYINALTSKRSEWELRLWRELLYHRLGK
tara:strand:- start:523 stop:1131 length:609 start_codon:yes stop_codon:yes gene_type:complete